MLYKARIESSELQILKSLNTRLKLPENEKRQYFNLKKGYEGEVMFDVLAEGIQHDCLVLNDLLLQINNTLFQIDTLIIMPEAIYLFEVKNYEGDYFFEKNRLYKIPKKEVSNPLTQLSRTESLLRQLLQAHGFNISIKSYVVFINPAFTLYQAPLEKPFIFPTQIDRFLKKLNNTPSKLNKNFKLLADKLRLLHIEDSPIKLLPQYHFEQLQKGLICDRCSSLSTSFVQGKNCVCKNCGHRELLLQAVLRSAKEFKLLFPDEKITTNIIHEWCKVVKSKKQIRRILEENFTIRGTHRWTYYE